MFTDGKLWQWAALIITAVVCFAIAAILGLILQLFGGIKGKGTH